MSTPFTEVYSIFLNDITDRKLANLLSPEELGDILTDYLMESANIHFGKCKKDLQDVDFDLEQFNETLSYEEKIILSKGMKLKWLSSNFVFNEEKLNSRMTTKDYKVFSPANHLRILLDIEKEVKREIKSLVTRYLYNNMIKGGN